MSPRFILPAFAFAALALLTACGGGKHTSSANSDSGGASPPGAVLDRIDLAQSAARLETLTSFRFDISMKVDTSSSSSGSSSSEEDLSAALFGLLGALGDIKASGAVVSPDQAEIRMTLFGSEFGYVQLGDKAWEKTGGSWQPTTPDGSFEMKPEDLFGNIIPAEVLKGAKTSSERVNGVQTTHYSFDKKALESVLTDLGEQADFSSVERAALDIWLNADNVPVKMAMDISGVSQGQKLGLKVEMNITDINDRSIQIKPPV